MDELIAFLRARLAEDEKRVLQWHDLECSIHAHLDSDLLAIVSAARMLSEVPGAVCDCGGPALVLGEIEAKREVLRLAVQGRYNASLPEALPGVGPSGATLFVGGFAAGMEHAVRLFAVRYAAHPDYRPEWRP